jgi:hypothetical protein
MWLHEWYQRLRGRSATNRRVRPLARRVGLRPTLEQLEDRTVPSTLTVLNNLDSGPGSLRAEIAAASSGDTIVFAASLRHKTITLTSGELAVTNSLDIEGPGANNLAISGNAVSRVFDIGGGVNVTLAGLTITNGLADHGGGILNEAGASLTLTEVSLSTNRAVGGEGEDGGNGCNGLGGGIDTDGGTSFGVSSLTVTGSTIFDNRAQGGEGDEGGRDGQGIGGGLYLAAGGTVSLTKTKIMVNHASTSNDDHFP